MPLITRRSDAQGMF